MATILPQQRLLLELLEMSGDIAVPDPPEESILWRTLGECLSRGWVQRLEVSAGFCGMKITKVGRSALAAAKKS